MNFDDLVRMWREEGTGDYLRTRVEALSSARNRVEQVDASVRRRDLVFTVFAVLFVPILVSVGVRAPSFVSAFGVVLIGMSFAASWLLRRRARHDRPDPTLPVRASVADAIARLRAQERFLGYLRPWVLLPLAAGMILAVAGAPVNRAGDPVSVQFRIGYTAVVIALVSVILAGSRYTARKEYRPLREDLESWLEDLDEYDESSAM